MKKTNIRYSSSQPSSIEWTGKTWNVTIGCTPIAPGCDNCYAAKLAKGMRDSFLKGQKNFAIYRDGFKPKIIEKRLFDPYYWAAILVFVNSMSDTFHEEFPLEFLQKQFAVMVDCKRHIYQLLTKRAERALELSAQLPWPENLWLGVSVGCKERLGQIDYLRQIPAAVRFLSLEPLLEDLGELNLEGIHWVIIGGESPGLKGRMRPCRIEWIENIVRQCDEQGVAVFVKQFGGDLGKEFDMRTKYGTLDLKGGEFEKFPKHLQRREYPIDIQAHFDRFKDLKPMIGGTPY